MNKSHPERHWEEIVFFSRTNQSNQTDPANSTDQTDQTDQIDQTDKTDKTNQTDQTNQTKPNQPNQHELQLKVTFVKTLDPLRCAFDDVFLIFHNSHNSHMYFFAG